MFNEMLEPILEIGKHLGMQGLLLVYIVWFTKQTSIDQNAQRNAHSKEREEWKEEDRRRQQELIDMLNKTNSIDSKISEELALLKSEIRKS